MKKVEINIESTRRIIGEMKETLNPGMCRCFVDAFLIHKENQEESDVNAHYYHEDNLLHCAMNLFGAGTDTTATTLQWGLLYITKYPHIQGAKTPICLLKFSKAATFLCQCNQMGSRRSSAGWWETARCG